MSFLSGITNEVSGVVNTLASPVSSLISGGASSPVGLAGGAAQSAYQEISNLFPRIIVFIVGTIFLLIGLGLFGVDELVNARTHIIGQK